MQLRAVVFVCLTQEAQIPAHIVSCWCAPTFWVPATNKARSRNLSLRRVRAHCTNCELCAGNRFLVCTLAYVKIWFNPAHSLSSSISYAVVGLGADHRCARALRYLRAMRLQQEFSIRTFIRCLFAGRPSAVSCILYQSTGTS